MKGKTKENAEYYHRKVAKSSIGFLPIYLNRRLNQEKKF
jgi:hypothetical protein